MSDPHLKRPVWLTAEQRLRLKEATVQAIRHPDADIESCKIVLSELIESTHRNINITHTVRIVVKGLKMPKDTLPVFICDVDAYQIIQYGNLDGEIANILIYQRKRRKK